MTTADGRFTALMPHAERVFRNVQLSWTPGDEAAGSAWGEMFRSARRALAIRLAADPRRATEGRTSVAAKRKTIGELRSQRWFSAPSPVGPHKHRRIKQGGYSLEDFKDKPVIAILSTWSDFQTCHAHFPQRIEEIKRGIWQAGGFPAVIPVQSVSESFLRPTSMLYRNLLAMEAEEAIRAIRSTASSCSAAATRPAPACVMAAASMNVPAIFVPAGAMLKGRWRQHTLGTGSSTWAPRPTTAPARSRSASGCRCRRRARARPAPATRWERRRRWRR